MRQYITFAETKTLLWTAINLRGEIVKQIAAATGILADTLYKWKTSKVHLSPPNNTWIAAGAIICAGVTIGDNSVIGAGSVVTRIIPADVFACGVPCRVVRELDDGGKNELVSEVSDK